MIEIAIMIEGQNGLNWDRWKRIATAIEELGFAGLYRSDHFTNLGAPDKDSLEMWISLTWLASHTRRIEFGPMVTPFSFRHPVFTARMAKDVDDLSGGRLILGVGAGWQEREHAKFGFDLLDLTGRFDRFEEAVEVVYRLLRSEDPVSFSGEFYRLDEAILLPRPQRPGGPPLLIGGKGRRRTLPLTAKYADEWNAGFIPPGSFASLNDELDRLLEAEGRPKTDVRRSLTTWLVFGVDDSDLDQKMKSRDSSLEELLDRGAIVGGPTQVAERISEYEATGAQRIMLQWLDLDDMAGLEALAKAVL